MKIFISYSTHDLKTAESVYTEMVRAGAEAFQFRESAIIGKPSWEQVLDWISECDTFIVLISRKALESKPVREEIGQAHHSYMNSPRPEKIVSAILDKAAKPPRLIERFATVDFLDYDEGMGRLMSQLGLDRTRASVKRAPSTVFSLPDLGPIFQDFKKKNPGPTPVEQFSTAAETILTNYDALKPGQLAGAARAKHLDLILSGLPGASLSPKAVRGAKDFALKDYNKWFLGYDPGDVGLATPALAESLLNWTPKTGGEPLPAPALKSSLTELMWNEIPGATGYALEGSTSYQFEDAKEMYRGGETRFRRPGRIMPSGSRAPSWFRVKAIGGVFKPDSAWSNVASDFTPGLLMAEPLFAGLASPGAILETPTLELRQIGSMVNLTWTEVAGATRYVLERSTTSFFVPQKTLYEGPLTFYMDADARALKLFQFHYHVKATAGPGMAQSRWSNAVTSNPGRT